MMKMQQDAIARVREMQSRTRQASGDIPDHPPPPPPPNRRNQGWNTSPGQSRPRHHRMPIQPKIDPPDQFETDLTPIDNIITPPQSVPDPIADHPPEPNPTHSPPPDPAPPEAKTTVIEDILKAVGLDDDRLLIIGLLFILINSKADNTLILALIYLLI